MSSSRPAPSTDRESSRQAAVIALTLAALLVPGMRARAAQESSALSPPRVAAAIYSALRERGSTCVCVELEHTARDGEPLAERSAKFRAAQQKLLDGLSSGGYRIRHRYRYSPFVLLEVDAVPVLDRLENAPDVKRVFEDVQGRGGLLESAPLIGADQLHERGILGAGRVTAVLDTGIDSDHPDLKDSVVHQYHFLQQGDDQGEGAEDDHGHGTRNAGVIASRGVVAPRGIAPASSIVAIKVLGSTNRGWFSDWAAGVEHVARLHMDDNGIQVDAMNLSLVSFDDHAAFCEDVFPPLRLAIEAVRELGVISYACSGNDGSLSRLSAPGCYASTVAVGSVLDDGSEKLSTTTSRGPLLDLVAPGEWIESSDIGGVSGRGRGCSVATPHAAAVATLMREVDPGLDPDELWELMRRTGMPLWDEASGRIYPRLDAGSAVRAAASGDCNGNGERDFFDIRASRVSADCNGNDIPDECDLASGESLDLNENDVPDECAADTAFHRGDFNTDDELNLADPVSSLEYLFAGEDDPLCLEAADANDDGRVDLADSVFLLAYLFRSGPPPPAPGPPGMPCGIDTGEHIGCTAYPACGA